MRIWTRTTGTGVVLATTLLAAGCSSGGGVSGPLARESTAPPAENEAAHEIMDQLGSWWEKPLIDPDDFGDSNVPGIPGDSADPDASQDDREESADRDGGGNGSGDTGADIHGVWAANDNTAFGFTSQSESPTGLARTDYADVNTAEECYGLLFDSFDPGFDYYTMLVCDEEAEEVIWVDLTVHGEEKVTAEWRDEDRSADYFWLSGWEDF
ncbi:hypothetical protein [Streptomyces sp. G-5]|uniref:hypothetical protein n=1 Tax=Streptomyces sp. G-5 TaxID=2977231 RepID=UPI0021CFDEBE|nr:hypothetical protein [Streptomyces sp. G-5]MCU4748314.1 hypothetical protein [Streptomyces sp. G-5]